MLSKITEIRKRIDSPKTNYKKISPIRDLPKLSEDPIQTLAEKKKYEEKMERITEYEKKKKNLPWIEKYRPTVLEEILDHKQIIKSIQQMIREGKFQHMLFFGPPGSGKTSVIVSAAKQFYEDSFPYMVLEINASSGRGIDVVRERILKFVSSNTVFQNQFNKSQRKLPKLVILDEADALTSDAQNALRIIIEKYTKNARFCLICNTIAKIMSAIQSRCTKLKFTPIAEKHMRAKIKNVCKMESIKITEDGINTIIEKSHGDLRFILNTLQSFPTTDTELDSDYINCQLGYPTKENITYIYKIVSGKDFSKSVYEIRTFMKENSISLCDITSELHYKVLDNKKLTHAEKFKILDKLAEVQVNQAGNTNENIQLVALVSCFYY
jgi:replication factor C subunit 3/5